MTEPTKLVKQYELGRLTWCELLIRLAQAAVEREPAEIAAELPAEVLAELRNQSIVPPATTDGYRVVGIVSALGAFDTAAFFEQQSELRVQGLRRWHRYFADLQGHPTPGIEDDSG